MGLRIFFNVKKSEFKHKPIKMSLYVSFNMNLSLRMFVNVGPVLD